MIKRNYNGTVNHRVMRDLRKLCDVNAENEKELFEAFRKKGEVSVYENLDPFTGSPDEMSTTVTMKSEAEVKEYLKKDFLKRVEGYLHYQNPTHDYLMSDLAEYIKENGRFPSKDEMRQLEKDAEAKRISDLPSDTIATPKEITDQDVAREILQLAEEIIETRRETRPEDIFVHVEPYDDELSLSNDEFSMNIEWDRYEGVGDYRDYSCSVRIRNTDITDTFGVLFQYQHDGTIYVRGDSLFKGVTDVSMQTLIAIHKFVAQMAKAEGIEFTSEICKLYNKTVQKFSSKIEQICSVFFFVFF